MNHRGGESPTTRSHGATKGGRPACFTTNPAARASNPLTRAAKPEAATPSPTAPTMIAPIGGDLPRANAAIDPTIAPPTQDGPPAAGTSVRSEVDPQSRS